MKKLNKFYYSTYKKKLKESLHTATQTYTEKEGIILRYDNEQGSFYGEAASLLQYPSKSLREALDYLNSNNTETLLYDFKKEALSMPPSIRMALDSIRLDMQKNYNYSSISLNAMLGIKEKALQERIDALYKRGFRVFKVKTSKENIDKLLEDLLQIKEIYPKIKMRIDSNQSFSTKLFYKIRDKLKRINLEYWEDPFLPSSIESWIELKKMSIPAAIDQGILEDKKIINLFLEKDICDFFILKPSCLAGLKNTSNIIEKILRFNKKYIISSSLETELGLLSLMKFTSLKKNNYLNHGLATSFIFSESSFLDKAKIDPIFIETEKQKILKKIKNFSWKEVK